MSVASFRDVFISNGNVYVDDGCADAHQLNLDNYTKITVTGRISFLNNNSSNFATIDHKLDIKNVKTVTLDHQTFKLGDIKKLENVEEATIYNNDIKKEDGTAADPADVFKILKNVKRFIFRHESGSYKKETAANLIKEPHFPKLEQLILHNVTPDFDLDSFLVGINKFHPKINCSTYFKKSAFTSTEFEELRQKIRNISPKMFPNAFFGF